MSNNVDNINGFPEKRHNKDEVYWMMLNSVTGLSRNRYSNNNFQLMIWMFDKD